MANNDIWQVIDKQRFREQDVLNVYFYRSDNAGGSGTAEELAQEFFDNVLSIISLWQTADLLHTEVQVKNLFNPTDAYVMPISHAGSQGGAVETFSTFVAVPFVLAHENGAIRNGAKRIAGVTETAAADGILTNVDINNLIDDSADAMLAPLPNGATADVWYPVVVKRVLDGLTYGLPTTPETALFGLITDVIFNVLLTSQTSRKIGVGT